MYEDRKLSLPDEETERQMYERTGEILAKTGFRQYEISNYAKKGFACRHNLGYWTGVPYYGFGLGASGYLPEHSFRCMQTEAESIKQEKIKSRYEEHRIAEDTSWVRYRVTGDLTEYLQGAGIYTETENLTNEDREAEFMILGLRLTDGIEDAEFARRFGCALDSRYGRILDKYCKTGFLIRENGRTKFSRRGISVSNSILAEFL